MRSRRSRWSTALIGTQLSLAFGACGDGAQPSDTGPSVDASTVDAAVAPDANDTDAGPAVPASTDHCTYEPLAATARAGGNVTAGNLTAGTAEAFLDVPVGVALGAYTARAEAAGRSGFVDARREPVSGSFGTSVGIETAPRVRALALTTGSATPTTDDDETVIVIKADLGVAYQGLLHELESRLGAEYAGKILIATSHSHSSFANWEGHGGLQVGFGPFRRPIFDRVVSSLEAVARAALAARGPARIGFAHNGAFDVVDRVTHDRRSENDVLMGGSRDDRDLFLIRVDRIIDESTSEPLAVLPVFGVHGVIHDDDNPLIATDAPGGIDRVFEEAFARAPGSTLPPVLVAHLQGAGGDVSPGGVNTTSCDARTQPICSDYAKAESVGWLARAELLAAFEAAGTSMDDTVSLEMVTRSVDRGPNWENFTVRDGALRYAPWDGRTPGDQLVYGDDGMLLSPIDEFNAPHGAALCGEDTTPLVPRAAIPGTAESMYSYRSCYRLAQAASFFELAIDIELGGTPICDTTRTTLSALRIEGANSGRWVVSTLPGEPVTLLVETMRARIAEAHDVPADHMIVVGYAQDHHGYLLTAEDWLAKGYEPTITFWGPLDGEQIMERAIDLVGPATTAAREDTATGSTHVRVPPATDFALTTDQAGTPGTVPTTLPSYLATRRMRLDGTTISSNTPANVAANAQIERLESVFFTWVGENPTRGTPIVTIEHEVDGSFVPLLRRSGRPVHDGDFLLTWTPDPLLVPTDGMPPRTHYWTIEWQAVNPLGAAGTTDEAGDLAARAGLPLGRYRFSVRGAAGAGGSQYTATSATFEVVATPLAVTRTGNDVTVAITAPDDGFRLLGLTAGAAAHGAVALAGQTVSVRVGTMTARDVVLDATGHTTITDAPAGSMVTITDAHGNTGSVTF